MPGAHRRWFVGFSLIIALGAAACSSSPRGSTSAAKPAATTRAKQSQAEREREAESRGAASTGVESERGRDGEKGHAPGGKTLPGSVHNDTSPPLRDIAPVRPPKTTGEGGTSRDEFLPHPKGGAPDGALQRKGPVTRSSVTLGTNVLGVGAGFSGPAGSFTVNSAPPDTNSAIGPNHLVEIVNSAFAIMNKSGTPVYGPAATNTLWSGFGGHCQTDDDGDGIVRYDRLAARWIISQFANASAKVGPYYECIAVSQTSDPTGAYYRYSFQYSNFPDYPKMGIWPDAYYVTYNMFTTSAFAGTKVCAMDRAKMMAGLAATQQCFDTSSSYGGLLPGDVDSATAPPLNAPNPIAGLGLTSTTMATWKFHVDWTTPANSTFTGPTNLTVASYTPACNGGTCVVQPGTTQKLDSLADRLMNRYAYRNFGDHESMVFTHSVTAGTGSGIRWYEFRMSGGNPVVYQQGTYAPDNSYRWMGSAAMDQAGNIALGYSLSSSVTKPSVMAVGRLSGDPLGTMTQTEATLQAGGGVQNSNSLTRWGDYASVTVDPVDDCTFWFSTEYLPSNGSFNWATRNASFQLSGCIKTAPGAPTIGTATPGDAQAGLTWTAPASDGGSTITGYVVTPYIGAVAQATQTFNSTATSQTVTGLTNATSYTFKVAAINAVGTGPQSAASNTVTPASAPGKPTNVSAVGGNAKATVSWEAPVSDGGSPLTGYSLRATSFGNPDVTADFDTSATTRALTGLTNGTTYNIIVSATNVVGSTDSDPSADVTPVATTVAGAPTGVSATAGVHQASVSWTAPADDGGTSLTGYVVTPYLGAVAQPASLFDASVTTRTVTGLTAGATYTFTVSATNAVGTGAESGPSSSVTLPDVPSAPAVTKAIPGNGSATVTWTAPASTGGAAITGYVVTPYISGAAQAQVVFNSTAKTQTVTGLTNGTTYTFRVAAKNAVGTGAESPDSGSVTAGSPLAPGFQTSQPGNATAKVAWTTPSNNGSSITGYRITPYIGTTPQAPQTFNTTATSDVVTGLANGTTYSFGVAAINGNGVGIEAVTTPIIVGTPTGPGFPTAVPGTTTARLTWAASVANGAPLQGYIVTPYIGSVAQTPVTFNSTSNVQVLTGFTVGTSYSFKIAAFNSIGTGPQSQTGVIIEGAPANPAFQSAMPGNTTANVIYLIPAANAAPLTSYTVWPVQGSTVLAPQVFNTPASQQLTVSGLTNGTTYSFRVAATNSVGTGPYATTKTVVVGAPTSPGFPSSQPGNGTAKVAWLAAGANGSPITSHVITPYIGTVAQTPQTFNNANLNDIVTGLTSGTTYTFKISAVNAVGASTPSTTTAIKVGTPTSPGFPNGAPLDSSAKVAFQPSVANGSPITGYVVTPVKGTTVLTPQTFNNTNTTQIVTGLVNGTTYTFRIAGINAVGTGPYGTTGAVKVGLPSAPTGVTATAGTGQATVSWTAPAANGSPISGYVVTPYIGGVAQSAQTFHSTATSRAVTGLTSGSSYTFKVAAINDVGTGAQSSASAATAPIGGPTKQATVRTASANERWYAPRW